MSASFLSAFFPAFLARPFPFTPSSAGAPTSAAAVGAGADAPSAAAGPFPRTAARNPAPGRKTGTVVAGTATGSPVRGLRVVRAARARPSKTPKPVSDTASPERTVSTIVSSSPSTAAAAVRRSPMRSASASTSWDLFMAER